MLIVAALHCEAKPIIEHFKLVKDVSFPSQALFRNRDIFLIESGLGKLKAAIATTRLLASPSVENTAVINIGTCGSAKGDPQGKIFAVNKITDAASGCHYYPDILFEHELPEATLTTFDKGVIHGQPIPPDTQLVDMEASGCFEATSLFLPPHRILCLKVVSDNLEANQISEPEMEELMRVNLGAISETFTSFLNSLAAPLSPIVADQQEILAELVRGLRLTKAQAQILNDTARAFVIRTGRSLDWLKSLIPSAINSKATGKQAFSRILQGLEEIVPHEPN